MKLNRKVFFFLAAFILMSALGSTGVWKKGFNSPGNALAQDEEEKKAEEPGEQAPCPECPECPDPAKVVLRGLEEKKQTIEKARKTLEQERKDLEKYEEQIDEKLTALESVKKQIQDDLALIEQKKSQKELENEAAYEAKLARLVKMYAAMKPKSAAQIVDKMDLEVAQEIFFRMREASASQILSFVDSGKAAKISERLAYKRK